MLLGQLVFLFLSTVSYYLLIFSCAIVLQIKTIHGLCGEHDEGS